MMHGWINVHPRIDHQEPSHREDTSRVMTSQKLAAAHRSWIGQGRIHKKMNCTIKQWGSQLPYHRHFNNRNRKKRKTYCHLVKAHLQIDYKRPTASIRQQDQLH